MSIFALIGCIGGCGDTFDIESFSINEFFNVKKLILKFVNKFKKRIWKKASSSTAEFYQLSETFIKIFFLSNWRKKFLTKNCMLKKVSLLSNEYISHSTRDIAMKMNQMNPCSISFSAMYSFMAMRAIQMVKKSFRKKSTPKKSYPTLWWRLWCFMHRTTLLRDRICLEDHFDHLLWLAWLRKCTSLERILNKLSFG